MHKEHCIRVDEAKCVGCGECRRDCPAGNIDIIDRKAVVKTQDCTLCGHCVAICPKEAVSMTGFDEPPMEIGRQDALDPQRLLDALRTRRSIRRFTAQPVDRAVVDRILEAGRWTPTARNAQDVSYIVLNREIEQAESAAVRFFKRLLPLARLVMPMARNIEIDDRFFFKGAPVAVVVVSRDKVNGALAASNMALTVEASGLGVLYSGFFTMAANHSGAVRRALRMKREKAVTTLVLGYADVRYRRTAPKETAVVRRL